MSKPVKIGSLAKAPLRVELFSSVQPSREVLGSPDGVSLALTIFGEDSDSPLKSEQLVDGALLGAFDQSIIENGKRSGLAAKGKVKWEPLEGDDRNQRLSKYHTVFCGAGKHNLTRYCRCCSHHFGV